MYLIFFLRRITRFLYRFRGLSRLADRIRKLYLNSPRKILINDFDGDLYFNCALNEHISSQVFWRGAYSTDQLRLLGSLLKDGMVFFDIGANKGEFTVFAAKRLPGGQVWAFEPVEQLCADLKHNVSVNQFQNVHIVNRGLGNSTGEAPLFAAENKYDGELNLGVFSIYQRKKLAFPSGKINILRLDDFVKEQDIKAVDVIKIDIEGAELEMLRGARETIDRFKPVILMEVNEITSVAAGYRAGDLLDFLGAVGYSFKTIGRNGTTGSLTRSKLKKFQNILCLPA